MKLNKICAATLLALGMPIAAQADLTFDADGVGGDAAVQVATFDWDPTSFLGQNSLVATQEFITSGGTCDGATGCQFDVLTHTKLIGTLDSGGDITTQQGIIDNTYEITMIMQFTEEVIDFSVSTNTGFATSTFNIVDTADMFLEIYYDDLSGGTLASDALTGSGFDDGVQILFGDAIASSIGVFTSTTPADGTPVDLDQSADGNDYDGQLTIEGTGNQGAFEVDAPSQDFDFFKDLLATFGIDFANISQQLPYISVNPSDCFTITGYGDVVGGGVNSGGGCDTAHTDGLMNVQTDADPGVSYVPQIGPINGAPGTTENPAIDFIAQTDFNSPVQVAVPEPGTLALMGLGFGALGLRRRRQPKS